MLGGLGRAPQNNCVVALTVQGILRECSERKGIHIAGIVDCASPAVLADLRALVDRGDLVPLPG